MLGEFATGLPEASTKLNPASDSLVPPVVTLSNLAFLASSILILPLASVRVMTFSPEVAVVVSVIPPLIPIVSPNLRLIAVFEVVVWSFAPKFKPLAISVALVSALVLTV